MAQGEEGRVVYSDTEIDDEDDEDIEEDDENDEDNEEDYNDDDDDDDERETDDKDEEGVIISLQELKIVASEQIGTKRKRKDQVIMNVIDLESFEAEDTQQLRQSSTLKRTTKKVIELDEGKGVASSTFVKKKRSSTSRRRSAAARV